MPLTLTPFSLQIQLDLTSSYSHNQLSYSTLHRSTDARSQSQEIWLRLRQDFQQGHLQTTDVLKYECKISGWFSPQMNCHIKTGINAHDAFQPRIHPGTVTIYKSLIVNDFHSATVPRPNKILLAGNKVFLYLTDYLIVAISECSPRSGH